MEKNIVIGIDLGTTNSCTAFYSDGKVRILENEEGNHVTSSFLFFTEEGKIIVGQFAAKMSKNKPEFGIYGIKRLIGRNFHEPCVRNIVGYFPFKVSDSKNGPVITICQKGEKIVKTPQQLCTTLLQKLKVDAQYKLGHKVEKVVITVPAYFNDIQRKVTLDAAHDAGFKVLKLLNEPTAAALSYFIDNDVEEKGHSLVYDLGGGTFDVSVVKGDRGNIEILCVDGDTDLGGQDFDNIITEYILKKLREKDCDPRTDKRLMRRIQNESEEAKKSLSASEVTSIILEGVVKGEDAVEIPLSRKQFEEMSKHLFEKTIDIVDRSLARAKLSNADIKRVILSGGSTRIPKIQQMLTAYFGQEPNKTVNPDECVAAGAAIQAAMLSPDPLQKIDKMKITDVTPFSLGITNFVNLMTVYIEKNTPIPFSKTLTRVTVADQQKNMQFKVYEGERMDARKNRLLATVEISDITPAPPGKCEVTFTMAVDGNGMLKVKAQEEYCNNVRELAIGCVRGVGGDREVKNALKNERDQNMEDEKFVRFARIKEYLLDYCEAILYNCREQNLSNRYLEECNLCQKAKEDGEQLEVEDEDKLQKLIREVETRCLHLVTFYKFVSMPKTKSIFESVFR